jgi:hypothetical protein
MLMDSPRIVRTNGEGYCNSLIKKVKIGIEESEIGATLIVDSCSATRFVASWILVSSRKQYI